jgi:glycosyltransferase involved in cell wall biosynthesis
VLVVDAFSGDGSHAIAQRATYDRRVRLLDNPRLSAAAALNIGLEQARGEIVVRVDARTVVAPDYLAACAEALRLSGADSVAGSAQPVGATPWGRAAALAVSSTFGGGRTRPGIAAYRRATLALVGGWDEELGRGDDDELELRLRAAGGGSRVANSASASYRCPESPGALWRERFGQGRAEAQLLLRHPEAARASCFAPAALVLALGGGALLAPFVRRARALWLAGGALYALALAVASIAAGRQLWEAGKSDDEQLWRGGALGPLDGGARPLPNTARGAVWLRLPLVFAYGHWAQGVGLLVGVVRAMLSRKRAT